MINIILGTVFGGIIFLSAAVKATYMLMRLPLYMFIVARFHIGLHPLYLPYKQGV